MAGILDRFDISGRIGDFDISLSPQSPNGEAVELEKKRLRRNQTFVLMGFAALVSYFAYTSFKK